VRDLDRVHGQYLGLLRFTPPGWRRVAGWLSRLDERTRRALEMTHLLQGLVSDGVPVGAVPVDGRWCEVDSVRDLALYESRLDAGAWAHDWRFPKAGTRASENPERRPEPGRRARRDAPGARAVTPRVGGAVRPRVRVP